MARRKKTRPQCLRPYSRGVRGEAESADRGDESGNCGGAAAEGFGRGRWKPAGGEGQTGWKVNLSPTWVSIHWYLCRG